MQRIKALAQEIREVAHSDIEAHEKKDVHRGSYVHFVEGDDL